MNDLQFTILAYAIGLTLMWGYLIRLTLKARTNRSEKLEGAQS